MKKKYFSCRGSLYIMLACVMLAGCSHKKDKPTPTPPVKVTVMSVDESSTQQSSTFSGTVASSENTTVSFSVAGTITALYASEGQKVTKGQLLGKVRDGDYVNAKNIADAQLAEAQDAYNRLKKLHDANALPDVKWVEMQQKLTQAQNAAEMAERTLKDADLKSPAGGTITRKFADVGQTVLPVQPIYEIVSTDDLTINISVTENQIGNFKIGQKASVTFDAEGIPATEGTVTQTSVVADPLTRSYTVKIAIPTLDGKVLPGMVGSVKFDDLKPQEGTQAIILPSQAVLLNHDNRLFVWVVKEGKAERRFVEADELAREGVIVKSGLLPGDSVIIQGMQKVGTGTSVIPQSN